jgi:hypothetical protein
MQRGRNPEKLKRGSNSSIFIWYYFSQFSNGKIDQWTLVSLVTEIFHDRVLLLFQ